ncbi:hypothetical protein [Arsenicibacter rosenii]|uniref:ABC transmembrane type-1 domain-containing protein n=1 Tax=Arsenicibacter rosenii TaxID=1750698 RepID=A0A1S2VAM9_9BACT|nr:hypothetical protein [Arsenicibacter rosenii]OIN55753.1 hypothetical protein BLX24_28470 [Arsenicibacter rosenii]
MKLSKHSVGPRKPYTPTPISSSLLLFRMAFSLLWQAVREGLTSLLLHLSYIIFEPVTQLLFGRHSTREYIMLAIQVTAIIAGAFIVGSLIVLGICELL